MPADQETIRYTGVYGDDRDGKPYLMREVLGGGSGGRYYADGEDTIHVVPDSRNLPTEFTESAVPVPRRAARPGRRLRRRRAVPRRARLREAHPDAQGRALHVDRRPLDPGLLGRQGRQGRAAVPGHHRPGRPDEREVDALADAEPVQAGEVIRIRTTGGGGWGDPLDRPYDEVVRDVRWGKVSVRGRPRPTTAWSPAGDEDAAGRRRRRPPTALRAELRGARTGERARSSTAAPATPGCPGDGSPPRSTGCDPSRRSRWPRARPRGQRQDRTGGHARPRRPRRAGARGRPAGAAHRRGAHRRGGRGGGRGPRDRPGPGRGVTRRGGRLPPGAQRAPRRGRHGRAGLRGGRPGSGGRGWCSTPSCTPTTPRCRTTRARPGPRTSSAHPAALDPCCAPRRTTRTCSVPRCRAGSPCRTTSTRRSPTSTSATSPRWRPRC